MAQPVELIDQRSKFGNFPAVQRNDIVQLFDKIFNIRNELNQPLRYQNHAKVFLVFGSPGDGSADIFHNLVKGYFLFFDFFRD